MSDHLREAVVQTLVAALVVEAVVRLWRLDEPVLKLRLRAFVVVMPLVVLPVFELLAPFRHQPRFADGPALFVGARWAAVTVLGVGLDQLWLALLCGLSLALIALDVGPWLREWRAARRAPPPTRPCPEFLSEQVRSLAARLDVAAPPLSVIDVEGAVLLCRGARRPALLVSPATLGCLDAEELRGALAHELAHLAHHDVRLGWALLVARLVQAWNPVVQIVARAMAADAEQRADDRAVAVTGRPLALASGLITMLRVSVAWGSTSEVLLHATQRRVRAVTVEQRCRRLMARPPPGPPGRDAVLLGATVVAVSALAFFIT